MTDENKQAAEAQAAAVAAPMFGTILIDLSNPAFAIGGHRAAINVTKVLAHIAAGIMAEGSESAIVADENGNPVAVWFVGEDPTGNAKGAFDIAVAGVSASMGGSVAHDTFRKFKVRQGAKVNPDIAETVAARGEG